MPAPSNGTHATNGTTNGESSATPRYDTKFTDAVIAATGPNANPRLAQIMPSLLRHLHDFAREVDLTVAEWTTGVDMINQAGQMSDDKRNETQLLCDILGLESLVDEISSKLLQTPGSKTTPSAVLGPFHRASAPVLSNGSSIIHASPTSPWYKSASDLLTHISGRVISSTSGTPISNASIDVWEAGPNGMYEQQDEDQPDMNLRGRFETDSEGRYAMVCLRPTAYPIPYDGPAGKLLQMLDRHPYRPAHIHFIVSAKGHRTLTTQVFDRMDDYVKNDAVFAVKQELLVDFVSRKGDGEVKWELEYDFILAEENGH
ncbi:Intradiol ring-cleavage dioxygenase [Pseudomassariella vexata]|uniref:Intradiol ring-cleavage dioxygenase n=1 Tax=Pseudomassariella vexata TaxID=1141098 RepID=A0A1Y2EGA6_9PEZI|nr:Intradiol ring-cleavage dioxygenase [Pseudomassariella vexata]ORY69825.1 Intradiol ring-cleavage dioxygenase [Pseudomassariella vexata]